MWTCTLSISLVLLIYPYILSLGDDLQTHKPRHHWRKDDAVDQKEDGSRASCCWETENTEHQSGIILLLEDVPLQNFSAEWC